MATVTVQTKRFGEITVDEENIRAYAQEHAISGTALSELVNNPQIVNLIGQEVEDKNQQFASFETIKKFKIVDEFTIEAWVMNWRKKGIVIYAGEGGEKGVMLCLWAGADPHAPVPSLRWGLVILPG